MMKGNRIVFKLGLSILVLFLAVLLPLGFIINQIFSGFYYSEVQKEINQLSSRYASAITSLNNPQILSMFKTLAYLTNNEIYIVKNNGLIVASSGLPGFEKGESIETEALNRLEDGVTIQKKTAISGKQFLVSGHPIIRSNTFYGGVFVLSSVEGIQQSLEKVRDLLILSGIGAFFIAVGFTLILSRKLSFPLIQMEKATRKIAKGSLNTRVNINSGDEIGHLAKAINDLAFELETIHANRQEFFANISHELRTPITYLEGYAHVIKQGLYQSEEEKERYLTIILQETKRLTRLIADLSELSKIEEGKLHLNLKPVDVKEVIEHALLKTELRAQEKGLTIKNERLDALPDILADGDRLEQIVINLLENAIRYTEKGTIAIKTTADLHDVSLMIQDTGIGIPEQELPHIFERFHRVEKSRSRKYGGTGLGLSIVKHLVELQSGTIQVFSEVGGGTTFIIKLPVVSNEEGENHESL